MQERLEEGEIPVKDSPRFRLPRMFSKAVVPIDAMTSVLPPSEVQRTVMQIVPISEGPDSDDSDGDENENSKKLAEISPPSTRSQAPEISSWLEVGSW